MQEFYSCIFVLTKTPARHITATQLNGVSRDAGLRGASRAQPALPDPDHAGGGILLFQPTILHHGDVFFILSR